jgi:hypothetical protein
MRHITAVVRSLRFWLLSLTATTLLAACGDSVPLKTHALDADTVPENSEGSDSTSSAGSANLPAGTAQNIVISDCSDRRSAPSGCGQLSISISHPNASCQLAPTMNDLVQLPRSVLVDCVELARGPNGYDFDALGHITILGDACEAMMASAPHRVDLLLDCPRDQ